MESKDPNPKLDLIQTYDLNLGDVARLNRFAIIESNQSVAPHSGVKIGAALLTSDNNIYGGQYMEDLVYGNSVTAEDFAVQKALAENKTQFKAISIYYVNKDGNATFTIPSGKWRQKIQDHGHFLLISCKSEENYIVKSSASLLPYSYYSFKDDRKLYFPNRDDLKEVLDAAANWLQIDHDEATRRELEGYFHTENYDALKN